MVAEGSHAVKIYHDKEGRYRGRTNLPITDGAIICTDETNLSVNANCTIIPLVLYPTPLHETRRPAVEFLSEKRGIRCNEMSGYCAEFNFRFFPREEMELDLGEKFLNNLAAIYEETFNSLR